MGDASHGQEEQTLCYLKQFWEQLRGRSAFDIEAFRQQSKPLIKQAGRSAAVAFSVFEQAMWDIIGKVTGEPIYRLLGGALRNRIYNYANINRATVDRTPEGFARMAEKAI